MSVDCQEKYKTVVLKRFGGFEITLKIRRFEKRG